MTARERLALQAWRAGFSSATVALIAELTVRRPLDGLDDARVEQTTAAVEVCAQAGLSHDSILEIARFNVGVAAAGEDWRVRFWSRVLASACRRAASPERYGLSPCDRPTEPPATLPDELAGIVAPTAIAAGGA